MDTRLIILAVTFALVVVSIVVLIIALVRVRRDDGLPYAPMPDVAEWPMLNPAPDDPVAQRLAEGPFAESSGGMAAVLSQPLRTGTWRPDSAGPMDVSAPASGDYWDSLVDEPGLLVRDIGGAAAPSVSAPVASAPAPVASHTPPPSSDDPREPATIATSVPAAAIIPEIAAATDDEPLDEARDRLWIHNLVAELETPEPEGVSPQVGESEAPAPLASTQAPAPVSEPVPEQVAAAPAGPVSEPLPAPEPAPVAAPAPTPVVVFEPSPVVAPEPEPIAIPSPEPEPIAIPVPEPEPVAIPAPEPEPVAIPAPEPEPVAIPAPASEPVLSAEEGMAEIMASFAPAAPRPRPATVVPAEPIAPAIEERPRASQPVRPPESDRPVATATPSSAPLEAVPAVEQAQAATAVPGAPAMAQRPRSRVRGFSAENVPEHELVAPVEMWFGDARVGVKPGSKTYDRFQRIAKVLFDDLKASSPHE